MVSVSWRLAAALCLGPAALGGQETGVRLDFQDVELRLVLAALADAGNLNIVYGDLPDRRVTLRMARPVPREQVPALLRSVAASNGLRVIEEDGLLRVESTSVPGRAGGPDTGVAAVPEARLYVYRLKHARAPVLAGTLQALFGGRDAGGAPGRGGLSRRPLSETLREQQIAPTDPTPPRQVDAELGAVQVALPGQLRGEVQIVPDQVTNALLVRAQPADWIILQQTIEALDLRPLQVLIEVLIAEVRRSDDFQLGVSAGVSGRVGGTDLGAGLTGGDAGDLALSLMRAGGVNIDIALRALSSRGDVRVLSRPVLLAQNSQEAHILIGAERPFIQVFRSLPTDAAVRDQVVQYRDVGTSLTILPTINADGYVNLQVSQEVSNATAETQFGAPVISTRETATHLFIRDGQTAVLGGLIDRQDDRRRSGIPLLRDLPVVGGLFGTTQRTTLTAELFVFITPHIVATDEDTDRVRSDLRDRTELLKQLLPIRPDSGRRVPPDSIPTPGAAPR